MCILIENEWLLSRSVTDTAASIFIAILCTAKMSDRRTKMDQPAKARIMSREYKENDGHATDWSSRAQRAADKNYPTQRGGPHYHDHDGQENSGGWGCVLL